ncbi:LutC/YkgG family protein [Agarivorans albus]|uniref:Predicted L-lactate dehydrogenase n=1 Tax=Agarivorans albus MKT 106 TaxID=1331007 RepID=R9PNS5_AGAAL|nr:lactate utilization protein [Agarivorans albus]GAD02950.1 predicted L-lactate dehydrogenase [Agarivorans albus MKT 106]
MAVSNSNAKQNIMQRLAAVSAIAPTNQTSANAWQASSPEQALARFEQSLMAAHADVIILENSKQLSACLLELQQQHQWQTALCGKGGEWSKAFSLALAEHLQLNHFLQPFEQLKTALFDSTDVTFTGCAAGIADTGTLVLKPSADEPRSLSLIAPCHVAVIKASQIVDNFSQLISEQHWHKGLPTNVVLISGPSKTADIQQTLAYGAHGPSQLIVIVINGE